MKVWRVPGSAKLGRHPVTTAPIATAPALARRFASLMLSDDAVGGIAPIVEAVANPTLREQARWYLIEAAPRRSQAFTRYLQDPDPLIRTALVDALGLSDDEAALALVRPLASDKDVQVARAVERALARLSQIGR